VIFKKIKKKLLEDGGQPCLNLLAISFLKKVINDTITVLETGSGRSTIWFAKRVKKIISFENKEEWAICARKRLKEEGLNNAVVNFDPDYPTNSFSKFKGEFDIVFLDGADRHGDRVACMKEGCKHVKSGGYLIVDDVHRATYKKGVEICNNTGWCRTDFWGCGYESKTSKLCSVWRRPK